MNRPCTVLATLTLVLGALVAAAPAEASTLTFTDRASFLTAVGASATDDDFESYALGDLANGTARGDFLYSFGSLVQPAVVAGAYGGQALGGPFDVFVGGDAVTLSALGAPLRAFGADFYYGPSFEPIPGGLYQLRLDDGGSAGTVVANLDGLDSNGGIFFLGILADPGAEFTAVSLFSAAPLDVNGDPYLVPAYQVDNLVYDTPHGVPEPASSTLLLIGGAVLATRRRTRRPSSR